VELIREAKNNAGIMDVLAKAIGMEIKTSKLRENTTLEIRDIDEEASEKEILESVMRTIEGFSEEVQVFKRQKAVREAQIAILRLPNMRIYTAALSKIRVGYVNCRIRKQQKV